MPLGFRSPVMEPRLKRTQFLNAVQSIAGVKPVACYLPSFTDSLTSIDPISGRVWTADAAMNGQVKPQGYGYYRVFNGTSNYLTSPDTTDLSFGNGTTDSPFSIFAAGNVTDTAAVRMFYSKFTTLNREHGLEIAANDVIRFFTSDESANVSPTCDSNAVATQGSWHTFASTYNSTGGATNQNGTIIYQDGAAVASTAGNNASYVAMENLAAAANIGASNAGTANFFQGNLYCVLVVSGALSAAAVAGLHATAKTYFT